MDLLAACQGLVQSWTCPVNLSHRPSSFDGLGTPGILKAWQRLCLPLCLTLLFTSSDSVFGFGVMATFSPMLLEVIL